MKKLFLPLLLLLTAQVGACYRAEAKQAHYNARLPDAVTLLQHIQRHKRKHHGAAAVDQHHRRQPPRRWRETGISNLIKRQRFGEHIKQHIHQ